MAAITGTATDSTPSASFTPSSAVSDVLIINRGTGKVWLEALFPGSANWVLVASSGGAFPVSTSDTAILYRFRGAGDAIDYDYYMGP